MYEFEIETILEKNNDNILEDKFILFNKKTYIAELAYKEDTFTKTYTSSIRFKDLNLTLFYIGDKFSNGWLKEKFIQPEHTLEGFIHELEKVQIDSKKFKTRVETIQEYLKTQEKEVINIYGLFLNMK